MLCIQMMYIQMMYIVLDFLLRIPFGLMLSGKPVVFGQTDFLKTGLPLPDSSGSLGSTGSHHSDKLLILSGMSDWSIPTGSKLTGSFLFHISGIPGFSLTDIFAESDRSGNNWIDSNLKKKGFPVCLAHPAMFLLWL